MGFIGVFCYRLCHGFYEGSLFWFLRSGFCLRSVQFRYVWEAGSVEDGVLGLGYRVKGLGYRVVG